MGAFSLGLLRDVEKLREAKRAAGGVGYRRGHRTNDDAVHCAGRNAGDARGVAILEVEREA